MRTEFAPRLTKVADIEEGKKQYDEMVDGVRHILSKFIVSAADHLIQYAAIGGRGHCQCYCLLHFLSC